jgi:hypothetical protein
MPLPQNQPDPALNRFFTNLEKTTADTQLRMKQYFQEQQTGARVEPVTLTMQEYIDIKTIVAELKEIDDILRHRDTGSTLIDGRALENILTLARKLALL